MVFSSPVFLFAFLPIALLLYYSLPGILKNLFLFIASFVFYAWGEVTFAYLILSSILINYLLALAIEASTKPISRIILIASVILNLSPLIYFKYSNFIKSSLGMEIEKSIVLPLGISFFTFHALSYVIDVYRKKSKAQKSIINLGLYITNFPQLVAGPIVRYPEIEGQLSQHAVKLELFAEGVKRFIIGLSKKVLIANTLASVADPIFKSTTDTLSMGMTWLGLICYALQIYFDFSGYSDMAVGLGKMFGFNFPENFNYPYIAKSVKEFWRRWHISLSNWFRDYVYIPLGGSHGSKYKTYFNLILIFFLCGLWHGASWTFIVWGLWHGAFLVIERLSFGKFLQKLPSIIQHIYALSIILIGWIFFRSDSLSYAFEYFKILIGFSNSTVDFSFVYFPDSDILIALIAGVIGATPIISFLLKNINERWGSKIPLEYFKLASLIIMFVFSAMALASGTYNPFIYYRF